MAPHRKLVEALASSDELVGANKFIAIILSKRHDIEKKDILELFSYIYQNKHIPLTLVIWKFNISLCETRNIDFLRVVYEQRSVEEFDMVINAFYNDRKYVTDFVIREDHLGMFQRVKKKYKMSCEEVVQAAQLAAKLHSFEILEWVRRIYHIKPETLFSKDSSIVREIVKEGNLEVLQRIHKICNITFIIRLYPDNHLFYLAAENGHIHILGWLNEMLSFSKCTAIEAFRSAGKHGHILVLTWLTEVFNLQKLDVCESRCIVLEFLDNYQPVVLMWMITYFGMSSQVINDKPVLESIIANCSLDILTWVINRFNLDQDTINMNCEEMFLEIASTGAVIKLEWVIQWFKITKETGASYVKHLLDLLLSVEICRFPTIQWLIKRFDLKKADILNKDGSIPTEIIEQACTSDKEWLINYFNLNEIDSSTMFLIMDLPAKKRSQRLRAILTEGFTVQRDEAIVAIESVCDDEQTFYNVPNEALLMAIDGIYEFASMSRPGAIQILTKICNKEILNDAVEFLTKKECLRPAPPVSIEQVKEMFPEYIMLPREEYHDD